MPRQGYCLYFFTKTFNPQDWLQPEIDNLIRFARVRHPDEDVWCIIGYLYDEGCQGAGFSGRAAKTVDAIIRAGVAVLAEEQEISKSKRPALPIQQLLDAAEA